MIWMNDWWSGRTRTCNLRICDPALCQLSYLPLRPRRQAGAIQLFGYRSPRITVCPTTAGTLSPLRQQRTTAGAVLVRAWIPYPVREQNRIGDFDLSGRLWR